MFFFLSLGFKYKGNRFSLRKEIPKFVNVGTTLYFSLAFFLISN